jgi:hypothetical protein
MSSAPASPSGIDQISWNLTGTGTFVRGFPLSRQGRERPGETFVAWAKSVRLVPLMASFGLSEAAHAIRERIGRNATYASLTPPRVGHHDPRPQRRRWERLLWAVSLVLLVVVLILTVLVALGL